MTRLFTNLFAILLGVVLYNYTEDVIWSLLIGAPIVIVVTLLNRDDKEGRNDS